MIDDSEDKYLWYGNQQNMQLCTQEKVIKALWH